MVALVVVTSYRNSSDGVDGVDGVVDDDDDDGDDGDDDDDDDDDAAAAVAVDGGGGGDDYDKSVLYYIYYIHSIIIVILILVVFWSFPINPNHTASGNRFFVVRPHVGDCSKPTSCEPTAKAAAKGPRLVLGVGWWLVGGLYYPVLGIIIIQ